MRRRCLFRIHHIVLWIASGTILMNSTLWAYSGGTGGPNDPYQIATAQDLIDLGNDPCNYDKCFVLTADIDLDPNLPGGQVFDRAVIAPDVIDSWGKHQEIPFSGSFDGQDHIISHLQINGQDDLGLFGSCSSSAVISNLGLEAVDVNGTGDNIGGLVGDNGGSITSSYSTSSVSGNMYAGGLVGYNDGSIMSSYSTGSVSGEGGVGGLVGYNDGTITSSYSTGLVSGTRNYIGGLVGYNGYWGSIMSSFWDIETSGQSESDGGIGLPTSQMLDINNYLEAGWDFVDETANGTDDIWWKPDSDYPRLWWEE